MFYQSELSLLCDVFKKCRLGAQVVELSELESMLAESAEKEDFDQLNIFREILPSLRPRTVYRTNDAFEMCCRLILLPDTETPTVFYIGPFLSAPISQNRILEIGERLGISSHKQRYLAECYVGLPVLSDESSLLTMFNTFCERIWRSPSFNTQDITQTQITADEPVSRSMRNMKPDDTMVNIKALEQRYAFENEMIRAVYLGQPHMEAQFKEAFSVDFFEKRHADPLRNAKNYGIIMNTLLRKAAEQGGVHPIQLDQVSSDFANKIEKIPTLAKMSSLMCEMFRTYCRLVQKHSLKHFSPIVQNTVLSIEADLSVELSPSALAASQSVSLGYLSTVFKKETGKTISAYIRERRMEYAAYLLHTTSLQVQTVALHCGIMDVQYFSKLFKKHYGKTPSEYRPCRGGNWSAHDVQ